MTRADSRADLTKAALIALRTDVRADLAQLEQRPTFRIVAIANGILFAAFRYLLHQRCRDHRLHAGLLYFPECASGTPSCSVSRCLDGIRASSWPVLILLKAISPLPSGP